MNTNESKDHDAEVAGKKETAEGKTQSVMLVKVGIYHQHPHADGCVGCRRHGVCCKCDGPLSRLKDRTRDLCASGACTNCCAKFHVHVDSNPFAVASAR